MPRKDKEDWLVSYLANTEYGKDPKLNAATVKKIKAAKARAATSSEVTNSGVDAPPSSANAPAPQDGEAVVMPQVLMLRKLAGVGKEANVVAGEVKRTSGEKNGDNESFDMWVASYASQRRYRRMSGSALQRPPKEMDKDGKKDKDASGKSPAKVLGPRKKSISKGRASLSGRRQSMDFSDLDAVRERLQNAASTWALQEDEDDAMAVDEVDASETNAQPADSKIARISLLGFKKMLAMSRK